MSKDAAPNKKMANKLVSQCREIKVAGGFFLNAGARQDLPFIKVSLTEGGSPRTLIEVMSGWVKRLSLEV